MGTLFMRPNRFECSLQTTFHWFVGFFMPRDEDSQPLSGEADEW